MLDTANWTWREYGQRIGIWRVMDVFDKLGVAPSCTCNGMIMVERRRIVDAVKERGWELVPHNWAQNDLLTYYAHNPEQERAVIRKTLDKYQEVVGRPAKAWLSSAIRGTLHTPAFLKEFGLVAYCDYLNDDQPYLIDTIHGPIVCVPYSNDINDFNMFARGSSSTRDGIEMLKLCFDQLHAEGATTGRIMNVGLHPHVIGQPHRIAALREFIEYVKGKIAGLVPDPRTDRHLVSRRGQRTCPDVRRLHRHAVEHHGDASRQQVRHCRSCTAIWHVQSVNAGLLLEQFDAEMQRRAGAGRGIAEFAGIGLEQRDEALQVLGRQRRRNHHHRREPRGDRNRSEVANPVIRQIRSDGRMHDAGRRVIEQRIAVRVGSTTVSVASAPPAPPWFCTTTC